MIRFPVRKTFFRLQGIPYSGGFSPCHEHFHLAVVLSEGEEVGLVILDPDEGGCTSVTNAMERVAGMAYRLAELLLLQHPEWARYEEALERARFFHVDLKRDEVSEVAFPEVRVRTVYTVGGYGRGPFIEGPSWNYAGTQKEVFGQAVWPAQPQ